MSTGKVLLVSVMSHLDDLVSILIRLIDLYALGKYTGICQLTLRILVNLLLSIS